MDKLRILSIVKIAAAMAIVTVVAGCSAIIGGYQGLPAHPTTSWECPPSHVPAPPYVGVIESTYSRIANFTHATGAAPRVVAYFQRFGAAFDADENCNIISIGAIPLVQVDPLKVSIARIGRGGYRGYLTRYAEAVKKFHDTVAISFGHEMNGNWYPWGYQKTPPSQFVRAWREIHDTFAAVGATNVIWVWTVNSIGASSSVPLREDWPGAAYVNWVGIDAYYWTSDYSFDSVIGPVLDAVRPITHDPVLIAETAVIPGPQQSSQIQNLFSGIKSHHLLGLVWFDINAKEPWRLEDHPAALAAFRQAVTHYMP